MCITTYQPDTKSNPYQPHTKFNPNLIPNPNATTKQHAIVNIQLNIVTCPTYPEKFMRDDVVALSVLVSIHTAEWVMWMMMLSDNEKGKLLKTVQ